MVRSPSKTNVTKKESYEVEKILDKRISDKDEQYYVKWKGRGEEENTWEGREELKCPDLINEFEKQLQLSEEAASEPSVDENKPISGFDRGLKPVRIKAIAQNHLKAVVFRLVWDDGSEENVLGDVAKEKCPQVVIKFYEEKIIWKGSNSKRRSTSEPRKNKDNKKMKIE